MRKWFVAVMVSLFGMVGISKADFIVIRVILRADEGGGVVPGGGNMGVPGGGIVPPGMGLMGVPPIGPGNGGFPGMGAMGIPPIGPPMGFMGGPPMGNGGIRPPGFGAMGIPGPRSEAPKSSKSESELLQVRPGGNAGFPGMGMGGFPGMGAMGVPPGPPMGFMGGFPGMGAMGVPPAPPMGFMGNGGVRPPMGLMGGPPMGFMGGPPMGFMGGPSLPPYAQMGGPPMGYMGGPGMGNMGGGVGGGPEPLRSDEYVTVVVEVNPEKRFSIENNIRVGGQQVDTRITLPTKYGTSHLFSNAQIQLNVVKYAVPKIEAENIIKARTPKTADQYLAVIEEYLGLGLVTQAKNLFDIQSKALENKDAVSKMSPQTKAALEAYLKIKEYINQDVAKTTSAKAWQEKLALPGYETSKHYALIHPAETGDKESAKRRLAALEKNLDTVFLWFALRGKALNPLTEKLVAVQVGTVEDYRRLSDDLNVQNSTTDGFHARREGLVVFAPERMDKATRNFRQMAGEAFQRFGVEDLLKGKQPNWTDKGAPKYIEYARASTLALVDQMLTEEGEIASATCEGTKQLLTETGLLPKGLLVPEWLVSGLASIFETPKSNFPNLGGTVRAAFWHGGGSTHWVHMKLWEETFNKAKISPEKQCNMILNTVTDKLFRIGNSLNDSTTGDGKEIKELVKDLNNETYHLLARSLSWGLVYYLARERFEQFDTFLTELKQLPRDVELTDQAVLSAFCRAFGVKDFELGARETHLEMEVIARKWLDFMKSKKSYTSLMKVADPNLDKEPSTGNGGGMNPAGGGPSTTPGFPGGGVPGFPGGGPMIPGGGFPGGGPMIPGGGPRPGFPGGGGDR